MPSQEPGTGANALVVSTSLDRDSRSERVARLYSDALREHGVSVAAITLKDYTLPGFDNPSTLPSVAQRLHQMVLDAEAVVLATPIYNWGCSAELKRFIEFVGSTPPNGSLRGGFFDKIVTFVCSSGLPHSYMGFAPTALAMMLDFKCIINPYHVYVHNQHWEDDSLVEAALERIDQSATVLVDMMNALRNRTYRSNWSV